MEAGADSIRISNSAHRHGIGELDILHAYRNATGVHVLDDDAFMLIGPKRDGSPLEVGVRYHPDVNCYVIFHAMTARRKYTGVGR